jgi:hypothetical protein
MISIATVALELSVARTIDLSHSAALAKQRGDVVRAKFRASGAIIAMQKLLANRIQLAKVALDRLGLVLSNARESQKIFFRRWT